MQITARGRRVQVDLNGARVLDADLDQSKAPPEKFPGLRRATGRLGLQSSTGRVEFRALAIRALP